MGLLKSSENPSPHVQIRYQKLVDSFDKFSLNLFVSQFPCLQNGVTNAYPPDTNSVGMN